MITDIEARLVAEMREYASDLHVSPDIVDKTAQRHRRHSLLVRFGAGAATLAAVAVAVVATSVAPGGTGAPDTPTPRSVAYVLDQTRTAMAGHDHDIAHRTSPPAGVHAEALTAGGRAEAWIDHTTGTSRRAAYDANGALVRDTLSVHLSDPAGQRVLTVDYQTRTWREDFHPDGLGPGIPLDAVLIQRLLDEERVEIVGTERMNGVTTLHLHVPPPPEGTVVGLTDLWVDESSYEIVRVDDTDWSWLPRTPENLERLRVVPPPDFTRVP
jgi:hypothetical protein